MNDSFQKLLLVCAALFTGCAGAKPASYTGLGFILCYDDAGVSVKESVPASDFTTTIFSSKDSAKKVILNVYSGGAPQTNRLQGRSSEIKDVVVGSISGKGATWFNGAFINREIVFPLPLKPNGRQLYVHLWYEDLTQQEAVLADQIIASLRDTSGRY